LLSAFTTEFIAAFDPSGLLEQHLPKFVDINVNKNPKNLIGNTYFAQNLI